MVRALNEADLRRRQRRVDELKWCGQFFERMRPLEEARLRREHEWWIDALARCLRRRF